MAQTVLFCTGCNEKFAVSSAEPRCPQCGQVMSTLADAPTLALFEIEVRDTFVHGCDDAGDPSNDDPLIGTRLGAYSIGPLIGKGGMARVYRARHLTLGRTCAIKVLNTEVVRRTPEMLELFFSEARSAAALVHPHIVTVHNLAHDDGWHLIELEYVAGGTLQQVLDKSDRLDLAQVLVWMEQIASALAEAHGLDIVHRDIKPSNILINRRGNAKLADFGLAKRVIGTTSTTESLMGTPYFMAPELFQGVHASPQSDVYAFGVMFYFLLLGRPPFLDRSICKMARLHETADIPNVSEFRDDIPSSVADFIQTCLAKQLNDRFPNAAAMHVELQNVLGGLQIAESLILAAIARDHLEYERHDGQFTIRVSLDSGRSQLVFVRPQTDTIFLRRVISIASVCCAADPDFYEHALVLNCAIPRGAIAIEEIDGKSYFVIADTLGQSTCEPEDICQSIASVAQNADQIEMLLTNHDVN